MEEAIGRITAADLSVHASAVLTAAVATEIIADACRERLQENGCRTTGGKVAARLHTGHFGRYKI